MSEELEDWWERNVRHNPVGAFFLNIFFGESYRSMERRAQNKVLGSTPRLDDMHPAWQNNLGMQQADILISENQKMAISRLISAGVCLATLAAVLIPASPLHQFAENRLDFNLHVPNTNWNVPALTATTTALSYMAWRNSWEGVKCQFGPWFGLRNI